MVRPRRTSNVSHVLFDSGVTSSLVVLFAILAASTGLYILIELFECSIAFLVLKRLARSRVSVGIAPTLISKVIILWSLS